MAKSASLAPDDPRHGTAGGYTHHGCRCRACTTALTTLRRAWVARQQPPPPGDERHGKRSTFVDYRCRCPACYQAQYDYNRAWRAGRKLAAAASAKRRAGLE